MQAMNEFRWAQGKVEEVTGMSREQRESAACARRLEQMAKKREKQAKREANRLAEAVKLARGGDAPIPFRGYA